MYYNQKLEEFETYLRNKKVAIIGMGVSNAPLIEYLKSFSCDLTVFDKREEEKIDPTILKKIKDFQIDYHFGEDNLSYLKGFQLIFRSPSCRPDTKEIVEEVERGAILTSEIELLLEICPGKVIGVTGSDGKTTTTTLIYEMIKKKGYPCFLGGNIGYPIFTKLREMTNETIVVLELSSFQLMDAKVSPDIAVITNIAPNHLDIHKSYEEYITCKENIFRFQNEKGIFVTNYENDITRKLAEKAPGKVIFFSSKTKLENGYFYEDGIIKMSEDGLRRHVIQTKDIPLRGIHNYENICTALAATDTLVDIDTQREVIQEFKGVEHRLELVREIDGVKWYNDSIGTSPSRTIAGLNSFDEDIVLIAGGYDKHLDYAPIAKPILDNVTQLVLMGATAPKIYEAVVNEAKKEKREIPIHMCDSLEEAIHTAKKVAKKDQVVLFSPASASFDLFKNFAERGEKFKELVWKL